MLVRGGHDFFQPCRPAPNAQRQELSSPARRLQQFRAASGVSGRFPARSLRRGYRPPWIPPTFFWGSDHLPTGVA
eukprot:2848747-Alexandrium_andersonii.AAC.1